MKVDTLNSYSKADTVGQVYHNKIMWVCVQCATITDTLSRNFNMHVLIVYIHCSYVHYHECMLRVSFNMESWNCHPTQHKLSKSYNLNIRVVIVYNMNCVTLSQNLSIRVLIVYLHFSYATDQECMVTMKVFPSTFHRNQRNEQWFWSCDCVCEFWLQWSVYSLWFLITANSNYFPHICAFVPFLCPPFITINHTAYILTEDDNTFA